MAATSICDIYSYYSRHFDIYCEYDEDLDRQQKPCYRFNVYDNAKKEVIETSEWIKSDDLAQKLSQLKDKHYGIN